MSFKGKMQEVAKSKQSPIVLALDFPFTAAENRNNILIKAQKILESVHPYICAVKINHHLTLPLGTFDGVQSLVEQIRKQGLLAIMDAKVNDIGATNQVIAEYYYAVGFDAIIANPFVGWEEGLKPLFAVSKRLNRGVILLTYMSHKGAGEGYGQIIVDPFTGQQMPQYVVFAKKAVQWGADGVVVGATCPEKIIEVKQILGDRVAIYSPGVGVQGGGAEAAVKAGANYLIVGREITLAEDPTEVAKRLCAAVKRV
ncbi:MAG: orotidine-5'-phosphate decarboxylase [Nitrososphaerota archaeon]|jgi:orotidine-5'-phosphate decarboxylase|nr:orotidine-5'-phosphate decarboxylase [Nitrososphaerota archaeon]